MKYRHYAPRAKVVLADAPSLPLRIDVMKSILEKAIQEDKKVGVFACDEMTKAADGRAYAISYGSSGNVKAASARLFSALREMDEAGVDLIIAETLPIRGIGVAYMNRLLKSAGISIKEKN
jgi:L-threonylcarbamoyladenylate synthase